MSLQFPCPCGRLLQVSPDLGGKRVRCPSCQRIVWAPAEMERVPEARIVDAPQAPKSVPVAASANPQEPPMARPAEAPSPARAGCCVTRHDCGAVAGFVLSLGSLAFGVVTVLFPFSWPVGGAASALISCRALRRIRSGRGNPASAGLARAGLAIGLGQALIGLVLWTGFAALCVQSGRHGGNCTRFSQGCPSSSHSTRVIPAAPDAAQRENLKPAHQQEAEEPASKH